jgi:SAM-dependent methyltransferase
VILTLATSRLETRPKVSYLLDDLRATILRDDLFEIIVCISTLEHVGLDNTRLYTPDGRYAERDLDGFQPAVQELRRMLAPGGRLLLTVPFGRREDHGWLQQFDAAGLERVAKGFGSTPDFSAYYRYDSDGWHLADAADCAACAYFDVHSGGPPASDGAAAARAVACLVFTRP